MEGVATPSPLFWTLGQHRRLTLSHRSQPCQELPGNGPVGCQSFRADTRTDLLVFSPLQVFWLFKAISQDPKQKHVAEILDKCEKAALNGSWVSESTCFPMCVPGLSLWAPGLQYRSEKSWSPLG